MRFSAISESVGASLVPFTVHGIEFKLAYPEDDTAPKGKNTIVEIKSVSPDAVGARMFDALASGEADGMESKYKSSLKRIRWVTEEGNGVIHALFDCPQEQVQSRVNAFATAVAKELQPKKPKKTKTARIPAMEFPGCKVTVLQGLQDRLSKAIRGMGYVIEKSGYQGGSTEWAVAFFIDKTFDINKFEDDLRDVLDFSGWLKVEFFDLVEK